MGNNPTEIFSKEAPEVAKAFNGLIESLVASKGLDAKTKQLIYIAMKAAEGDETAMNFHVPMAKELGATKAEVVDAILMTLSVSGIQGVVTCLPAAVQQFDSAEKKKNRYAMNDNDLIEQTNPIGIPQEPEGPQIYPHVILKVIETSYVTHDVKRFVLEKPPGYTFIPGQSVNVSINLPGWEKQLRSFTFTNLPGDNYLELMIKIYREHNGVTKKLESINKGYELILHDIFGVIHYKEDGVFIAAGSGITPFLSIFRYLKKQKRTSKNILIYSNKTKEDVIMGESLFTMFKGNFIPVFTRENVVGFLEKRIDRNFLIDHIKDFKQHFYICGPETFVKDLREVLLSLGATIDHIIFES